MPETDPAPAMEEKAITNGGPAAAPEKKDMVTKEAAAESKDTAVAEKNAEEQNQVSENGNKGPKDVDVKMAEAQAATEGDGDVGAAEQLDSGDATKDADAKEDSSTKPAEGEDIKMAEASQGDAEEAKQVVSEDLKMDADANKDNSAKPEEGKDVKMVEAENVDVKDEGGPNEDNNDEKNLHKEDELKENEDSGSADLEQSKADETCAADKHEEEEAEEKYSADKKEEDVGDDNVIEEKAEKDGADNQGKDSEGTDEQVSEADKVVEENKEEIPKSKKARSANEEKAEKDGADNQEKDSEETDEQVSEDDKVEAENKEETTKSKKARSARDRSQGKDKKPEGIRSREAKSLLNTPSPYGTDRPQRERKTVERLVEAIEKESNKNFVVEKGRGTPLKDIPNVSKRISRKKPADLKLLHSILFGKKGKAADFKGHILQFSGFVWHESDEKMRAKAKEKLDKCVKDDLLDLCSLFAIPVPKGNVRKEDIVTKLLDFIAEPHGVADSGGSDDQGSHSKKRKWGGSASKTPDSTTKLQRFGGDLSSAKRSKKALELNSDEDEDDYESMKSDSEENKDEDLDVGADEHEDDYDSAKDKTGKKSSAVKQSSGRKKTDRGSGYKTGAPSTISKGQIRKSSSKISREQESPDGSAKVFSRKRKPSSKGASTEKETNEKKSSGKKVIKGKEASAEAVLPSKDELRKTIVGILKKVDFNKATFSDILKKLDNHYKMDLAPKKEAIKVMIQDELTKLSELDDEDDQDAGKKRQQHQTKEVKA